MAQRNSTYDRKPNDLYNTPPWVTQALLPHLPARIKRIWEPACGEGHMVHALRSRAGTIVYATDIEPGEVGRAHNFLEDATPDFEFDLICSNPPFNLAQKFIERALRLTEPDRGMVAMLLRTDYDHAKGRRHLFADNPAWAKRIVLTKRIVWFVDPLTGKPKASPSENHSWFLFDHTHEGAATIAYAE